ncbi:RagB/SusD domain protein [Bacteroides uniformis]|uniref:RagB/SusD domain protein n=1 Tax=Bacteroides uniformis TaxID=820 RepID=A0A174S8R7_BACUN|nr:RagB/SusD family nutrient uptake outer membrane protein [Bacteroides uniformis]CUP90849.1 RagB/SusD domain protein [Bacteroides uniformis]
MKTLKYILLSCTMIALTGCDDFLVETPKTSIEKEGVYNSLSSAKAALAGCYASMAGYNYTGFNYFHVLNVTSGMGVSIKANDVNLTTMNILPTDVNMTNAYNGMYETIRVANDIIDGMVESKITNEAEKNRITGEACFMRGLTYFNLVRMFGKVSLVTKPVTNYAEAQVPRTEVSKVYEQIISDLDAAYDMLPLPANKVEGHPHKYAAQALLAKVYLTMAGNDETSEYWQKAYDAALDVYQNGQYKLVRPYEKLFGSPNKNNEESIFEIQFSASVNSGRTTETTFPVGHELMSNIATEGKSWGKTRPTQMAFHQFDEGDPRREASFVYGQYTNIFETNANKKNVLLYPTTKKDGTKNKLAYKQGDSEYAAWKKYYDPTMTATASNTNFVFYRYADLLLVLAEAANEIGSTDATTYLNEVLDRARDANGNGTIEEDEVYPLPFEGSDKVAMRERIFRERLKELTGECDEWYTVRRRGAEYLKKIMEEHNAYVDEWYASQKITALPKFVYKYQVTDETVKKNLLFPFPADEINKNEHIGQEDQNYGY